MARAFRWAAFAACVRASSTKRNRSSRAVTTLSGASGSKRLVASKPSNGLPGVPTKSIAPSTAELTLVGASPTERRVTIRVSATSCASSSTATKPWSNRKRASASVTRGLTSFSAFTRSTCPSSAFVSSAPWITPTTSAFSLAIAASLWMSVSCLPEPLVGAGASASWATGTGAKRSSEAEKSPFTI